MLSNEILRNQIRRISALRPALQYPPHPGIFSLPTRLYKPAHQSHFLRPARLRQVFAGVVRHPALQSIRPRIRQENVRPDREIRLPVPYQRHPLRGGYGAPRV